MSTDIKNRILIIANELSPYTEFTDFAQILNKLAIKTFDSGIEVRVIMPRDKERESNPEFKKMKHRHSAVESNINMLEHHGLNRCMDKGLQNFKRYVGLSVLAYNLHIMGNALIEAERKKEELQQKRRMKMAA